LHKEQSVHKRSVYAVEGNYKPEREYISDKFMRWKEIISLQGNMKRCSHSHLT
jgi:hypothetical protein